MAHNSAKNILATTLGFSWQIVPELIGFTNPEDFNFYKNHKELDIILKNRKDFKIPNINELWIATTYSNQAIDYLKKWYNKVNISLKIKIFILDKIRELNNITQCRQMGDLIFRMVFTASKEVNKGTLLLSLSGGRKTMSADMQEAGNLFGCHAMIHVIDIGKIPDKFKKDKLINEPLQEISSLFMPIITFSDKKKSSLIDLPPNIYKNTAYLLKVDSKNNFNVFNIKPSVDFYSEIENRKKKTRNIAFNFYNETTKQEISKNFYGLYFLPIEKINFLKSKKITSEDYNLLKRFPKPELHCHLGGIATPEEILEIAEENREKVDLYRKTNTKFNAWLQEVSLSVKDKKWKDLKKYFNNPKKFRTFFHNIPSHINVAGFLIQFMDNPENLKELLYGKFLKNENFQGIGIEQYEKLGDFQGSALLQSELSINKACEILLKKAIEHNVTYLEVRCSPFNYTKGGLSAEQVVEILIRNFSKSDNPMVKIIFIGSRHRDIETIKKIIQLAENFSRKNEDFNKIFVGFDIAGNESTKTPKELKEVFLPVLEKCLHITIHAGETEEVESIWEAVFHLSADRIGHGLRLNDNKDLKNKIYERKIAIEMCPSSNCQIVGYKKFTEDSHNKNIYPLKDYLENGIKVTVNTDNLGISLTDFTNEYIKASQLSANFLSMWNILQLIRNGFISGFCTIEEKRKLLKEAEEKIVSLI